MANSNQMENVPAIFGCMNIFENMLKIWEMCLKKFNTALNIICIF